MVEGPNKRHKNQSRSEFDKDTGGKKAATVGAASQS
jgi:hypothetical protein